MSRNTTQIMSRGLREKGGLLVSNTLSLEPASAMKYWSRSSHGFVPQGMVARPFAWAQWDAQRSWQHGLVWSNNHHCIDIVPSRLEWQRNWAATQR